MVPLTVPSFIFDTSTYDRNDHKGEKELRVYTRKKKTAMVKDPHVPNQDLYSNLPSEKGSSPPQSFLPANNINLPNCC